MGKGSRKKKKRIVREQPPASRDSGRPRLSADAAKFDSRIAITVPATTLVEAGATSCFDMVAGRLEAPVTWDPLVIEARPLSTAKRCNGAISQLTLNVGGIRLQSPAIVTLYKTDRALAWVLTNRPKVKEYWRFEPGSRGTEVRLTLGYELPGSPVTRMLRGLMLRKKLERLTQDILAGLRSSTEGISP